MLEAAGISTRRARARGFTLIELLVVVSIVAVLIGLLLPVLAGARKSAQSAVSASNLKQLAVAQLAYLNDYREQWVNPFDAASRGMKENYNFPETENVARYRVIYPRDPRYAWSFYDGPALGITDMFGTHWASLMTNYISDGDLGNQVGFAPADAKVLRRYREKIYKPLGADSPPADYGNLLWDGSYWYSPTFFNRPGRYADTPEPGTQAGGYWLKYMRQGDVRFASLKVLLFERLDFSGSTRSVLSAGAVRDVPGMPTWNNPRSSVQTATADGSVRRVRIRDLLSPSDNEPDRHARTPAFNWTVPASNLTKYVMEDDGLESGDKATPPTPAYPAYFWGTRDGLWGRDLR